jgi:hypothetical protein
LILLEGVEYRVPGRRIVFNRARRCAEAYPLEGDRKGNPSEGAVPAGSPAEEFKLNGPHALALV